MKKDEKTFNSGRRNSGEMYKNILKDYLSYVPTQEPNLNQAMGE